MKRTAILFLALALLLTACTGVTAPEPTEALVSTTVPIPVPTQPTTEVVTVPTPEPTTEPVTEPAETPAPDTEPSAPENTEPEPVPTSWQVYTDWSAYQPYAGSGARYTRLHPGALDHFEPSNDYGMVFPYEAARQVVDWIYTGWDWLEAHYTYGFADRNGRLLTDGIYYRVEFSCVGDPEPRYYWMVSQLIDGDTFRKRFPGVEYDFWDAELPEVYGLISLDGSVMLDCAYPELNWNGNGFCRKNGGGRFDFTMLDADLEPLFTGEDVFAGVTCDWWTIEYGEGLYLVQTADKQEYEEAVGEYELINRSSWFCDETGKQVLGPYADASTFHDGLACVSLDGEHYGYIDKTGAWAIQPVYSGNWEFRTAERSNPRKTGGKSFWTGAERNCSNGNRATLTARTAASGWITPSTTRTIPSGTWNFTTLMEICSSPEGSTCNTWTARSSPTMTPRPEPSEFYSGAHAADSGKEA